MMEPRRPSLFQVLQSGPLKVSVVGSGNWGCVIAKIVALNAKQSYVFHDEVRMWVFEEMVDGQKLTDIINTTHENKKYLPGHKLPDNLIALPDVVEACRDADLLIFIMPHQFATKICDQLAEARVVPAHARGITLVKGLHVENGKPSLFSDIFRTKLDIVDCCVLSGANVANDVAREEFAEATIGYTPEETDAALIWQQLFDTPYFKVNALPDVAGVQVCGAVKNVIAIAAGFCDGLRLGTNAKTAIIRLGVEEMKQFAMLFFDHIMAETFFDSAGYADVITTVFGGRNARCAAEFLRRGGKSTWDEIEAELLKGQKLQGTLTTKEVYEVISSYEVERLFPLFSVTYEIAFKGRDPHDLIRVFKTTEVRPHKTLQECNQLVVSAVVATAKEKMFGEVIPLESRESIEALTTSLGGDAESTLLQQQVKLQQQLQHLQSQQQQMQHQLHLMHTSTGSIGHGDSQPPQQLTVHLSHLTPSQRMQVHRLQQQLQHRQIHRHSDRVPPTPVGHPEIGRNSL
ncbi:NAD-dependent glycerol-3-phosphate dehydrogenase [Besnoitia besnoiti]|uniref:Glycerol-3-phosphate dehydrogenase [NAD(+)] n=1 Tax=Besnoitia besnoiti TaxID=94643 RepID=A0A2A9M0R5_BESBE|nr:NAD-dependent glycerol-3-phosphate dehydrogenase [Besnoitia besnoiti]PFH31565.1 NAD-dependent glycerol-3-phosphate dehydrogenase [Besnoitia besnoiti]